MNQAASSLLDTGG